MVGNDGGIDDLVLAFHVRIQYESPFPVNESQALLVISCFPRQFRLKTS